MPRDDTLSDSTKKVSPLCAVPHWPGLPRYGLANLCPTPTFTVTLVCVRKYASGLELFTCVHDGCTVTDVPFMPGERTRSDTYYGIVGSEPDRESLVRQVVDYLTVTRCDNRTLPVGNEVLALIRTLAGKARARRQPTPGGQLHRLDRRDYLTVRLSPTAPRDRLRFYTDHFGEFGLPTT